MQIQLGVSLPMIGPPYFLDSTEATNEESSIKPAAYKKCVSTVRGGCEPVSSSPRYLMPTFVFV